MTMTSNDIVCLYGCLMKLKLYQRPMLMTSAIRSSRKLNTTVLIDRAAKEFLSESKHCRWTDFILEASSFGVLERFTGIGTARYAKAAQIASLLPC